VHRRGVGGDSNKEECTKGRWGGGAAKKSKGLQKPLRIPRKSPSTESNDSDGDGFSFGRMMGMMMMQNHLDNKQKERQYKSESEQREQECQLCREEMVIARKDACTQRQMMNVILMLMLNKNGGDNSNPLPSPYQHLRNIAMIVFVFI
jgi:hypothetical protein